MLQKQRPVNTVDLAAPACWLPLVALVTWMAHSLQTPSTHYLLAHSHCQTDNAAARRSAAAALQELETLRERMRRGKWDSIWSEVEQVRSKVEARAEANRQAAREKDCCAARRAAGVLRAAVVAAAEGAAGAEAGAAVAAAWERAEQRLTSDEELPWAASTAAGEEANVPCRAGVPELQQLPAPKEGYLLPRLAAIG